MSTKASEHGEPSKSTAASPGPENEALLKKIEGMEAEVVVLGAAIRTGRRIRLVLLLAALAFVAVVVWAFYSLGKQATSNENLAELEAKAMARFGGNTDRYVKQVRVLVDRCYPVLSKAASERIETDWPKYSDAIKAQADQFTANMQTKLEEQVTKHYEKTGERLKGIIEQEFPQVRDQKAIERLEKNVDQIMVQLAKKYYGDELKREINRLYDGWDHFDRASDPPKGEVSLEKELIGHLIGLVHFRIEELMNEPASENASGQAPAPVIRQTPQKAPAATEAAEVKSAPAAAKPVPAKSEPAGAKQPAGKAAINTGSSEKAPTAPKEP